MRRGHRHGRRRSACVVKDDRVELAGELHKGTVLMFLKGSSGIAYTIEIVWE